MMHNHINCISLIRLAYQRSILDKKGAVSHKWDVVKRTLDSEGGATANIDNFSC